MYAATGEAYASRCINKLRMCIELVLRVLWLSKAQYAIHRWCLSAERSKKPIWSYTETSCVWADCLADTKEVWLTLDCSGCMPTTLLARVCGVSKHRGNLTYIYALWEAWASDMGAMALPGQIHILALVLLLIRQRSASEHTASPIGDSQVWCGM